MKSTLKGLTIAFLFSLLSTTSLLAATTPASGSTAIYTVLSSTFTNTSPTTIQGGVGFTTAPAVVPLGTHASYGSGGSYSQAGTDQGILLNALNVQPCTFTFAPGAIDLSTDTTHGAVASFAPGVYCSTGAMNVSGPLTLNGSGTYIFRPSGALTTAAGASISGSSACDVFWTPLGATTLGANTTFLGKVLDNAGITIGANTIWSGSALAFGGTVTTDTSSITSPVCSTPVIIIVPPVIVVATTSPVITATTTAVIVATTTVPAVTVTTSAPVVTPTVVPTFPNTGLPPQGSKGIGYIVLLMLGCLLYALAAHKSTRTI